MSKFVWYDLMTPDMKAAADFYSKVVGWTVADSGMPGMDYTMINAGDVQVGGMMPPPPTAGGMPPMWNGYIYAADVDAKAKEAETLGGSIFQAPMDIPGVGRFAVVADPSGATFLLFKGNAEQTPAPAEPGTVGHVGWHELLSSDWKTAWTFYEKMFGWQKMEAVDMPGMGTYQTFGLDGKSFGGMMDKFKDMPRAFWQYYWNVDGIDAAAKRVTDAGGKVMMGPHQVPGGSWIVNAMDPQGAVFALVSMKK